MQTLLYQFDDPGAFPLLESETTGPGSVTLGLDRSGPHTFLRLARCRRGDDPDAIRLVVALPLVAVDGRPDRFLLDVLGDASGCELFLEADDVQGGGFTYSFGPVAEAGWHVYAADVDRPSSYWASRDEVDRIGVVPPVRLYRLGVSMGRRGHSVDIGIKSLSVTGDVRLAPPGIA